MIRMALVTLATLAALTGCVQSDQPILTDAKPLLGERARFIIYSLYGGLARDPKTQNYRWDGARYRNPSPDSPPSFTVHPFENGHFLLQAFSRDKNLSVEYAVGQKLVDGVFRVVAIDQDDADQATRTKHCNVSPKAACRISTREQLETFARATLAKPGGAGALAVQLTGQKP